MKRAFPQKVKPVLPYMLESNVGDEQSKQGPTEVNRKACTSAAMIGLAISMGASSLLLPRQNDRAVAAEPLTAEPSVATVPAYEVAALSATPEIETAATLPVPESSAIKHSVQAGETLWRIARLYQANPTAIATANGIAPGASLQVGQILQIPSVAVPTSYQVASAQLEPSSTVDPAADLQVDEPSIASIDQAEILKEQQDVALDRLKQKRDELKNSLAELRSEESLSVSENSSTAATSPRFETATTEALQDTASATETAQNQPQATQVTAATPKIQLQGNDLNDLAVKEATPEAKPAVAATQMAQLPSPVVESKQPVAAQGTKALNLEAEPPVILEPQAIQDPGSITIPEAVTEVEGAKTVDQSAYRVSPGDTLDAIARNHGISREEIIRANRIANPNYIRVDQLLKIPQVQEDVQVASTLGESSVSVPTLVASTSDVSVPAIPAVGGSSPAVKSVVVTSPKFRGAIAAVSTQPATAEKSTERQEAIKVATAPLSTAPFSEKPSQSGTSFDPDESNSPYINNLKAEIIKLREKYRTTGQSPVPTAQASQANALKAVPSIGTTSSQKQTASSVVASRQVNAEFSPSRYTEALQAEIRTLQQKRQSGQSPAPVADTSVKPEATPKIVAAAPLGSDAYDPLVKPLVGQMVSPDLPPLAAADRYLPENAASFKGYIWPAKGVLTSGYGWRWGRMHRGIDVAAPVGTPVVAAAPGVVITSGWNDGGYGNLVEIKHPDGSITLYAHNNRNLVRAGQQVEQGQQIAEMGSTGYSTGPHSHFEIHAAGQGAVNPMTYLASR